MALSVAKSIEDMQKTQKEMHVGFKDGLDKLHGTQANMQRKQDSYNESRSRDIAALGAGLSQQLDNVAAHRDLTHANNRGYQLTPGSPARSAFVHSCGDCENQGWSPCDNCVGTYQMGTRSGNYKNDPRRESVPMPRQDFGSQVQPQGNQRDYPATPSGQRGATERDANGKIIPYTGFAPNTWEDSGQFLPDDIKQRNNWTDAESWQKDARKFPCAVCGRNHYTQNCPGQFALGVKGKLKWGAARAKTVAAKFLFKHKDDLPAHVNAVRLCHLSTEGIQPPDAPPETVIGAVEYLAALRTVNPQVCEGDYIEEADAILAFVDEGKEILRDMVPAKTRAVTFGESANA
jgi:hypothetical protein